MVGKREVEQHLPQLAVLLRNPLDACGAGAGQKGLTTFQEELAPLVQGGLADLVPSANLRVRLLSAQTFQDNLHALLGRPQPFPCRLCCHASCGWGRLPVVVTGCCSGRYRRRENGCTAHVHLETPFSAGAAPQRPLACRRVNGPIIPSAPDRRRLHRLLIHAVCGVHRGRPNVAQGAP